MDMRVLMKQAQKMQEKMQREIAELLVEGSAGGGMVTVKMTGSHALTSVHVSPEVLEGKDAEMIEDLILAAVNDATRRVEEAVASKMSGLRLPGF
ncbi:MAG TPA: YbaB/EbfC family nucleoid-associated protein [Patescibacteria group bacterium]|nr:YbaB/EbfC family nucleoid-associated protein [Patescibacteria group bacterium]